MPCNKHLKTRHSFLTHRSVGSQNLADLCWLKGVTALNCRLDPSQLHLYFILLGLVATYGMFFSSVESKIQGKLGTLRDSVHIMSSNILLVKESHETETSIRMERKMLCSIVQSITGFTPDKLSKFPGWGLSIDTAL